MFCVLSKEKIYTYIISVLTVFVLLFCAGIYQEKNTNVVTTSSNEIVEQNSSTNNTK